MRLPRKLSAEKIRRLETAGFVWRYSSESWEQQYQDLLAFKEKHGHCHLRTCYQPEQRLLTWVARQRRLYKANKLEPEQVTRLEHLGLDLAHKKIQHLSSIGV